MQLGIERVTRTLGRPWFAWVTGTFILVWIGINLWEMLSGRRPFDHPPFQITLQMAVVTEQKAAKTIELLEELRRDAPPLPKRRDSEAEAMAQATDVREAAAKVDEMGTTRA